MGFAEEGLEVMKIEEVYKCIDENGITQIIPILKYIEDNYSSSLFDEYNSEKSHIPTWRIGERYVGIGCRKHYISLYFSDREAVNVITQNTPYCRAQKGCVNFSYKRELPLEAIFKGIDKCFGTTQVEAD